ncbi:MAG: hypothetical protein IJU05_00370 [Schwartzia sp.]|nr:hypothetical protein [Schwartzia sp. (in: firmicutes)]
MNAPTGNPHKYDDMIGLEHHVSRTHPPMARLKRAAQFAAFDALTGFGAAIHEAGRETEEKKELSEDEIDMIDVRLAMIQYHIKEQPNVAVTYFLPDAKKAGGCYVTVSGNVKMLDGIERVIMMADGTRIPIDDVRYIEGELFRIFE